MTEAPNATYGQRGVFFGANDVEKANQSPVIRRAVPQGEATPPSAPAPSRPLSDPMNLPARSPPPMSYGQLNQQRAKILFEMTCASETREKEEACAQALREELAGIVKGDPRERGVRHRLNKHVSHVDDVNKRILILQTQLNYIDQRLADSHDGNPSIDYPSSDELKNFAAPEVVHQKPKPSRVGGVTNRLRMHPVTSAGHARLTPGYHHLRQRSNPETSFIPPEILQRNRGIDPALSVGNVAAPFASMSSKNILDTSKSSINSFRVEGGPSTNASLQSINSDMFNPSGGGGTITPPFSISSHSRSSSYDTGEFAHSQPPPMEPKMEMLLISMLASSKLDDMASELLAKANSRESCQNLRQMGGIPLLLQTLHPGMDKDGNPLKASKEAKSRAATALHNIIRWQGSTPEGRREMQVLHLLEQVRSMTDVRLTKGSFPLTSANMKLMDDDQKGGQRVMERLMQLSFKTDYRAAIVLLGGIPAVGDLLKADHAANGAVVGSRDDMEIGRKVGGEDLRRHCCTVLTNLTFGSEENKKAVCKLKGVLRVVVLQLESRCDDLMRSAANLLRNLSWRSSQVAREALLECGAVVGLVRGCGGVAGAGEHEEATLRACTSALWNVSAHSSRNKELLCQEPGGLALILFLMKQWTSVKYSQEVVQNAAGILLNISSYVSTKPGYRKVLREGKVYEVLVSLLKSGSPEMLNKVCGILWNLSSRNVQDQIHLWNLGAVSLLWSIVNGGYDRETQLAAGQALKNMIQAKPGFSMDSLAEEDVKREPDVGLEAKSRPRGGNAAARFPPSPVRSSTRGPAKPPRDPTFQPDPPPMQKVYSGMGMGRGSRARKGHQRSGSYGGMTGNHHFAVAPVVAVGKGKEENLDSAALETIL